VAKFGATASQETFPEERMNRRYLFAFAALGALTFGIQSAVAQTQNWPQRSVKFVIPLGPGSGVDIGARLIADKLSQKWGKPVVIENKPGGDAIVAITAFLGANDDHVLLMAPTSTFTAHPFLHERLPYDLKDLMPIARVSNTIVAVGVPASAGINSVDDLIARARQEPGKLNSASATGANDFVVAGFLKLEGAEFTRVPYRDAVQAVNDLAEGRIQLYVAALAIMRPQVQAGKVKIIAVTNSERAPTMPDVPTARQSGHPALTVDGLVGLFGKRDMPTELRDRISADVQAAAADPEIAAKIGSTAQIVRPGGAEDFAREMAEQIKRVTESAAAAGVKRILQN
jgi:tripartite-type tricarboxylate transporter receptor subunit TctC